jgi:hypothetical protein
VFIATVQSPPAVDTLTVEYWLPFWEKTVPPRAEGLTHAEMVKLVLGVKSEAAAFRSPLVPLNLTSGTGLNSAPAAVQVVPLLPERLLAASPAPGWSAAVVTVPVVASSRR